MIMKAKMVMMITEWCKVLRIVQELFIEIELARPGNFILTSTNNRQMAHERDAVPGSKTR